MINNAVLRSVRYMLDLSDAKMVKIAALADLAVPLAEMSCWLKKDDDPDYKECNNTAMLHFLNGLILFRRGKNENHPIPLLETDINNNIVLKKLRVAFELKDIDMLAIYQLVDFHLSKAELSAMFRKPGHKNYRECGDQILRNFLKGLTLKIRNPQ